MLLIAPLLGVAVDNRPAVSRHRHLEIQHKTTEQCGHVCVCVLVYIVYVKEGVTGQIVMYTTL